MIQETLGEQLRQTREAKKLSIRDVTRETNIIHRYIEALENNEFNKFPSETYLLGFLRNYGNFLRLDEDHLIQLYKGQQISESQTPLEELTKPTNRFDFQEIFGKKILINGIKFLTVPILLFLLFKIGQLAWDKLSETSLTTVNVSTNREKIPKFQVLKKLEIIRDKGETLLKVNEAAMFRVKAIDFAFRLISLEKDKATLVTYPGESKVFLPINKEIESQIPDCPRQLLIQLKATTTNTAKIELKLGKYLRQEDKKKENKMENLVLKINVYINDNSYVEAYLDGKKKFAGLMTRGQEADWEARQTIQLHLGNADGVRITLNGKEYTFKGKVMNKIFSWKRDPIDPSKYQVKVNNN